MNVKDYINIDSVGENIYEFAVFLESVMKYYEGVGIEDKMLAKFLEGKEIRLDLLYLLDLFFKFKKWIEKIYSS